MFAGFSQKISFHFLLYLSRVCVCDGAGNDFFFFENGFMQKRVVSLWVGENLKIFRLRIISFFSRMWDLL